MARKPSIHQDVLIFAKNAVQFASDAQELRKAQTILLPAFFSLDLVATGIAIGRSKATVCRLQAEFRADYAGTRIAKKKRGGRHRQNMSFKQETQLLEPFFQKASQGEALAVSEIRNAYETQIGKKVPASTLYRMLARHGWKSLRTSNSKDQD